MKATKQTETKAYEPRRGRPRVDQTIASAHASAGQALVDLAREGAELVFSREKADHEFQRRSRGRAAPRRFGDDALAEKLEIGASARGVQSLAAGEWSMSRSASAKAVEQLVKHGLLAPDFLGPLAETAGHARLLAPFAPLIDRLRAAEAGTTPERVLLRRVRRHVVLYRAAVKDLTSFENDERSRFLAARDDTINALMQLRSAGAATSVNDIRALSRKLAFRVAKLLVVIDQLKSLHVQIRPAPRSIAARWVAGLFLTARAAGEPDFGPVLRWLSCNSDKSDTDLHTAIAILWELVIGAQQPWERLTAEDYQVSAVSARTLLATQVVCATPVGRLFSAEQKFLRRLCRSLGDVGVVRVLLFSMAARWCWGEEESDCAQTHLEYRLIALCEWVNSKFPGSKKLTFEKELESIGHPIGRRIDTTPRPTMPDLKELIRDLCRTNVRQAVELNADIPTATPRRQQFWYRKAA